MSEFNLHEYMKGTYGGGVRMPDLTKRIPEEEFEGRVGRLRAALDELGVDVAFAYGDERMPGDVGWLSGYDPYLESALVVVGGKKALVVGGPEGEPYAREMMRTGEYRAAEEFKIPDELYALSKFDKIGDIFREAAGKDPRRIGALTVRSVLPVGMVDLVKESTGAEVLDCSQWMIDARYHKSPAELEMMTIAAYISTMGMDAFIRSVEPGKRETECAAAAEYVMKSMGADRFGFNSIMTSGSRASIVVARASNRVIEEGDLVIMGTSARYEGMAAALGRTIVAGGKGNPDKFELIEHCAKAYELCRANYGYGKPAKETDLAVRKYFRGLGLENMYSALHGIGWTECWEYTGAATQDSTFSFPKGIASEIDVGVFGMPFKSLPAGEVGVRVEDPFCIDHDGKVHRLTSLPPSVNHLVHKT